jgi:transcriptional regulator with XRE-family HTH domain
MHISDHPLASLRHRRQLMDIPASQLATRIGCTVTTYNRYERGERRSFTDQAVTLAKMLGCTVEDLGRPITPEDEIAIIRRKHEMARGNGQVVGQASAPATPAPAKPIDEYAGLTEQEQTAKLLAEWGADDDGGVDE